ncbi:hypothetical protein SEA_KARDASHIAN_50 [Streptomyces phage Kardashian]|nr:hypothetical protein SEA_KARDASHIAN_50 [Streptomyces phage Kardashian]
MSVDEPFYYVEPIENGLAHAIQIGDHQIMLIHRRRNYRAFNETPTTEGHSTMKPKLAKAASKFLLSAIFSAAIGYAIKAEKKIEERIDEHYAEPQDDTQNN